MESTQFNSQILNHSDKLYRLAKSILRNENAAQDAVQELTMKLWEKRSILDEVENIQAFTMRSMRNLCLDTIRQQRDEDEIPVDFEYVELNPYQQTEQKDIASKIRTMINQLPELQRTIIRMRDVEEMDITEIAFITSISVNAVSVNLSRARQKIRDQILKEQKRMEETIWK